MKPNTGLHCPACVVEEPAVPMPWPAARRYGWGHATAIGDQARRGLHRTFPVWLAATSVGAAALRVVRRPVSPPGVVAAATVAQVGWVAGFAGVSGIRTALRLTRLDNRMMLPVLLSCPAGGPDVRACAHVAPWGRAHYVDGVFAWPRGGGGGSVILRRLLTLADRNGWALTLTALSPRTAAAYRRVGFRPIAWIYWMRREPGTDGKYWAAAASSTPSTPRHSRIASTSPDVKRCAIRSKLRPTVGPPS